MREEERGTISSGEAEREGGAQSLSPLPLLLLSLIFPPSLSPPGFIFFPNAAAEKSAEDEGKKKRGMEGGHHLFLSRLISGVRLSLGRKRRRTGETSQGRDLPMLPPIFLSVR